MQFADLPEDCHHVLTLYLRNDDLVALSKTSARLRLIYGPFSWKTCLVDSTRHDKQKYPTARFISEDCVLVAGSAPKFPPWFHPRAVRTLYVGTTMCGELVHQGTKHSRIWQLITDPAVFPGLSRIRTHGLVHLTPENLVRQLDIYPPQLYALYHRGRQMTEFAIRIWFPYSNFYTEDLQRYNTKYAGKFPEFKVVQANIELDDHDDSYMHQQLTIPFPHLKAVYLSVLSSSVVPQFFGALQTIPSLRTLVVSVKCSVFSTFGQASLLMDLLVSPSLVYMNNVPDWITCFKLILTEHGDEGVEIKGILPAKDLDSDKIRPLVLHKVTDLQDKDGRYPSIYEALFQVVHFPNLKKIESLKLNLDFIHFVANAQYLDTLVLNEPKLAQLDVVRELDLQVKDTGLNRYFSNYSQSILLFRNVTKIAIRFEFKLVRILYGVSRQVSHTLLQHDWSQPFKETNGGYIDENRSRDFIENSVFKFLNTTDLPEFKQVSKGFLGTWYNNVMKHFEADGQEALHTFGVGTWNGPQYYRDVVVEWSMCLNNYLLSQVYKLERVQELDLSFSSPVFPPLDQITRLLASDEEIMPALDVVTLTADLPANYEVPGEKRRQAQQIMERSMDFVTETMEPRRKVFGGKRYTGEDVMYEFDVGLERIRKKVKRKEEESR